MFNNKRKHGDEFPSPSDQGNPAKDSFDRSDAKDLHETKGSNPLLFDKPVPSFPIPPTSSSSSSSSSSFSSSSFSSSSSEDYPLVQVPTSKAGQKIHEQMLRTASRGQIVDYVIRFYKHYLFREGPDYKNVHAILVELEAMLRRACDADLAESLEASSKASTIGATPSSSSSSSSSSFSSSSTACEFPSISSDRRRQGLMLGMVFACDCKPGAQEWRDKKRCVSMVNDQQMDVWTYDDKHPEEEVRFFREGSKLISRSNTLHQHINGDFAVLRRFTEHTNRKFGGRKQFDVIAIDHFNGPTGWAAEKWVEGFIGEVMPFIGTYCLSSGGEVWVPRIPAVTAAIQKHTKKLTRIFTIEYALPAGNPIYAAGEAVASELEALRPPVCNLNAMRSLPKPYPFVLFRLKSSTEPKVLFSPPPSRPPLPPFSPFSPPSPPPLSPAFPPPSPPPPFSPVSPHTNREAALLWRRQNQRYCSCPQSNILLPASWAHLTVIFIIIFIY